MLPIVDTQGQKASGDLASKFLKSQAFTHERCSFATNDNVSFPLHSVRRRFFRHYGNSGLEWGCMVVIVELCKHSLHNNSSASTTIN